MDPKSMDPKSIEIEIEIENLAFNNYVPKAAVLNGDNDRKIKCSKCKRSVHFICTNLPMYQQHLFHTKNYRGLHLCQLYRGT